ncbi:hypothetical protein AB4Z40_32930 [Bosea sp. 2YAB26]
MSGRFGGGKWECTEHPDCCTLEWTKAHVEKQFLRWLRRAKLREAA